MFGLKKYIDTLKEEYEYKRHYFLVPSFLEFVILAFIIFLIFMILSCGRTIDNDEYAGKWRLWYNQPANEWTQALPVGNGRIGAMVFGGLQKEVIQFNEESLWAGQKMDYNNPGALGNLDTIRELFDYALQATEALGIDEDIATEIRNTLLKLPPVQIGADGTIQEWINDYEEFEPGHRHISHLLGLHPGTQITENTPELFHAAKKTIEKRLNYGGAGTGWSRAWTINFYARLKDGEEAYNHLSSLLQLSTLPNLFDTHPPFQIDGNFGGTAGIAEMLLQSHGEYVELLPALPDEWSSGRISGLKARGNFEFDMTWRDGIPAEVVVKSNNGSLLKLKHGAVTSEVSTRKGEIYIFRGAELEIQ